jgi:hypothetical protein
MTAPPISYLDNVQGEDSLLEGITVVFNLWQQTEMTGYLSTLAVLPRAKQSPVPNGREGEWASALV